MEAYKLWVRQNRQLIASLENIANTMTWFLPERFTSSEIGTEAVAAFLGLMTVLNQHILDTAPEPRNPYHVPGNASTRVQQQRCISLASLLSAVKQLEILVEVTAEHYNGREKKWNILAAMEAIKACLRFLILHQNGYRMLLSGGEAIHTEEASPEASVSGSSLTGTLRNSAFCGRQVGATSFPDTRKSFSSRGLETKATVALMKFGENVGIKSKPSWTYHRHQGNLETPTRPSEIPCKPSDVPCNLESSMRPSDIPCGPKSISSKSWELPDELLVLGEWVFILRPLLYVLLIRRYGLKSWKPWLASLALDASGLTTILAAAFLKDRKQLSVPRDCIDRPPFSSEEVQEVKRRQFLMVLYLTRDPFFSMYTRKSLSGAERALRPIPLIGSLGGKVVEFFTGIQARYCYTSGS